MIGVFPSAMFPWLQFRLLGFFAPTLGRLWLRFRRRLVPQHVRESLGFLPEPALAIPYRRLAFAVPYSHTSSMAPLLDVLVYFSSRPKPAKDFESQTVVCFGHRLEAMAALVEARYS